MYCVPATSFQTDGRVGTYCGIQTRQTSWLFKWFRFLNQTLHVTRQNSNNFHRTSFYYLKNPSSTLTPASSSVLFITTGPKSNNFSQVSAQSIIFSKLSRFVFCLDQECRYFSFILPISCKTAKLKDPTFWVGIWWLKKSKKSPKNQFGFPTKIPVSFIFTRKKFTFSLIKAIGGNRIMSKNIKSKKQEENDF